MSWHDFVDKYKEGDLITGTIGKARKGGYMFKNETGWDGFLPVSEVDYRRPGTPEATLAYVGKSVECNVLEIDVDRHNYIVGRKCMQRCLLEKAIHEFWASLKIGDEMDGVISSIVNYGIFVNLHKTMIDKQLNGFLHASRLPSAVTEYVKGETLRVKVIGLDHEKQRIEVDLI
jgi:ribosomal protein S1